MLYTATMSDTTSPTDISPDSRVCIDSHVDLDEGNVKYYVERMLKDHNVTEIHVFRRDPYVRSDVRC